MSFWKNLETALNVAIAAHAVNEGNKWVNQKKLELRSDSTRENALIDIAYTVGQLDNNEWQTFIAGIRLKSIGDSETDMIRRYCEKTVEIEINQFQQLITMNLETATNILLNLIDKDPIDRCIYIGLLMSKKRDVRSSYLLNNMIDVMNKRLSKSASVLPNGKIHSVNIETNVQKNSLMGMIIHVDLSVEDSMNIECSTIAWFYYSDGRIMKDINNQYRTSNGQVCTWEDFTPPYENSRYRDLCLFMPYTEFDLTTSGTYHLKFNLGLFSGRDKLDSTDFYALTYTQ
jgi:hypothetical protein